LAAPALACVVGPTGAGKTGAAIALAQALGGVVINCDSRQAYADFPLVTAQPTARERAACPHQLYGFLPTEQKLSAGAYANLARREIDAALGQGALPILVGGTGFYLRAVLEPLPDIPAIPPDLHRAMQERWEREGPALHDELARRDPAAAVKIHPHDRQRVTRALEVLETTGRPFSAWRQAAAAGPGYRTLVLGLSLPLAELYPRLDARIAAMLEAGALDEARTAWKRCPVRESPGWSGIGCAELLAHLLGGLSLAQARGLWLRNTRAYAKRQMTWFTRQISAQWFAPGQENALVQAARAFLARPQATA
jgi:tRNA dimethylallyltransferase